METKLTTEEIIEGNKLIADFMGWEKCPDGNSYMFPNLYPIYNVDDEENTGETSEQIEKAEFYYRWDWQIPVYSKFVKDFKNYIREGKMRDRQFEFHDWHCLYEKAIEHNDISLAFSLLVERIKWFNQINS